MPTRAPSHVRLVHPLPAREAGWRAELGDLGLIGAILGVGLLPLALRLAGVGRWSGATLGLATLAVLFALHQLVDWAVGFRRRRREDPLARARQDERPRPHHGSSLRAG